MKAESWTPTPRHGDGLAGLLYAAAVFWFAVLGGLAVVGAVVGMPLACYGDPAPGSSGACPTGVPPYIENGSLLQFAATIIGIVLVAIIAWRVTTGRSMARAGLMLVLAGIGLASIVLGFATDGILGFLAVVWLGLPAVLLLAGGASVVRGRLASPE